jgi:hypothetical protein
MNNRRRGLAVCSICILHRRHAPNSALEGSGSHPGLSRFGALEVDVMSTMSRKGTPYHLPSILTKLS